MPFSTTVETIFGHFQSSSGLAPPHTNPTMYPIPMQFLPPSVSIYSCLHTPYATTIASLPHCVWILHLYLEHLQDVYSSIRQWGTKTICHMNWFSRAHAGLQRRSKLGGKVAKIQQIATSAQSGRQLESVVKTLPTWWWTARCRVTLALHRAKRDQVKVRSDCG